MKMRLFLLLLAVGIVSSVKGHVLNDRHLLRRDNGTTETAPDCSLECLATLIPEYCGSLSNTTCICTDKTLATALSVCASEACSIPDLFKLEKYSKDSCGVKNDKSRLYQQLHLYYVLPGLCTVFVALRMFARIKYTGVGADDWMMVAAQVSYLVDTSTGIGIVANGFGQHTYYLSEFHITEAMKWFYISELIYIITITCTKMSLLLFFRRIFPNRTFRIVVWCFFGFVVVSNFSLLMALTFQCIPFWGNWENWKYKVKPVKCINYFAAIYVAAALSIFHDLFILIMPMPLLWGLNLSLQKKANLFIMFSVGSFVLVCSLIRLPTLMKMGTTQDPSYDQAPVAIWTQLEIAIGVICGCLPACRSLLGHLFPGMKMSLLPTNTSSPNAPRSTAVKTSRKHSRMDSSTRSFIELHDHSCSNRRASVISSFEGSDGVPITEKLVPYKGSVHTRVIPDGSERNHNKEDNRESGIMMTRSVDIQRHSDHGTFTSSKRKE